MKSQFKRLPDNTIEIIIDIPWSDIKAKYDYHFDQLKKTLEVPGFRKGKTPVDLAQKQISKSKVYEQVIKDIIPHVYSQVVTESQIQPIISPKIELISAEENKDWKIRAKTCEKPKITLGNYRQSIAQIKHKKSSQIWVPGKTKEKPQEPTLAEVMDALYAEIKVALPSILVDQQVERMLTDTYDELKKLGLTVEQYLHSKNKTSETLQQEYHQQAVKNLSLDFALEEVADQEKITVEPSEIDEVINKAKNDQEKQALNQQRYYLGSLLRRQKTLKHLTQSKTIIT